MHVGTAEEVNPGSDGKVSDTQCITVCCVCGCIA